MGSKEWYHQLRMRVRIAICLPAVQHRKAYVRLSTTEADWSLSLKLLRSLSYQPQKRTMLEIVLTGGMLTPNRYTKHLGEKEQRCPFGRREQALPFTDTGGQTLGYSEG